jgi:hypothetical protein
MKIGLHVINQSAEGRYSYSEVSIGIYFHPVKSTPSGTFDTLNIKIYRVICKTKQFAKYLYQKLQTNPKDLEILAVKVENDLNRHFLSTIEEITFTETIHSGKTVPKCHKFSIGYLDPLL